MSVEHNCPECGAVETEIGRARRELDRATDAIVNACSAIAWLDKHEKFDLAEIRGLMTEALRYAGEALDKLEDED